MSVDNVLDRIGGMLLPPRCVLCGGPGQRPCLDICIDCEASLPALNAPCPRCGMPSRHGPHPRPLCGHCLARPPPYARCLAPFEYAFPVDGLVQALKYRGQLAVGRVLGSLLGSSVLERGLHQKVDVVVPVPLHPLRHAARSFNQSAEIGRWAARRAGLKFLDGAVARRRDTRPQVGLGPAERHVNLDGAFTCANILRGLRVAVVDDVVTTGSTVGEIAGVLLVAGAISVDVWCVARATGPEQVDSGHDAATRSA